MARQFAPLPYDALDLAGDDAGLMLALVHLYREGHRARWDWLQTSERDLVTLAGVTRRRIRGLLDGLVDAGLAVREVVHSGQRREGTRLRLLDPVAEGADHGRTTGGPRTDHDDAEPVRVAGPPRTTGGPRTDHERTTYKIGDPVTLVNKVSASADARAREPAVTVERPDPRPGPASDAVELQAAELLAMQQADEPQHGTGQGRDHDAVRRALRRGVPSERLAALWAWSGVSEDPIVAGCRSGWRRWSSLLRAPHGDERLQRAWAWHVAGRPTDAPARASPRKRPSDLDALDAAFGALGLTPEAPTPPLRLVSGDTP